MRVLVIGLDNSVLNATSPTAKRQILYGKYLESLDIVVPANHDQSEKISQNVIAYGVGGPKPRKFWGLWRLAMNLARANSYAVVSVQDQYFLALIGWLVARKFKIKLEIQIHGFEKYRGFRKLVADFVIPKADGWRTVSERQKRELIARYNLPAEMVFVAPVFTDVSRFLNMERDYGKKVLPVALTVGRLVPVKRIDIQIRALQDVSDLELWVVGDGPERENLERLAVELGVDDRIKFWGWQDDLYDFYRNADIFVLTSESEGWGMAVIEAAAAGLPIIMTDVGCAGEFVKNGFNGIVLREVNMLAHLIQVLLSLINDDYLRCNLGETAQDCAKALSDSHLFLGKEIVSFWFYTSSHV